MNFLTAYAFAGPCAKRKVRCTVITHGGQAIVGENRCMNPQPTCPRLEGEGYEKCKTVCHQLGHAEENAVRLMELADLRGGTAFLQGHHYACAACTQTLKDRGVDRIFVGEHNI